MHVAVPRTPLATNVVPGAPLYCPRFARQTAEANRAKAQACLRRITLFAGERRAVTPSYPAFAAGRRPGALPRARCGRIMGAPALKRVVTDEIAPGVNAQSDDELLDWVRHNAETTYHPVGTCKMGHDPMAVVDDQLRVRGLSGLRVADASIMPTIVSGNTSIPAMMIGEKCSAMILADARQATA